MIIQKQGVALVTGASSGIGKAVAEMMAKSGYTVFGTSRKAGGQTVQTGDASYVMLPMALEDQSSIEAAVAQVIDRHGRIDVLVNAAGGGIAGAIEETTADEVKIQFDATVCGLIRVLGQVVPHMRRQKSGAIISIGSMAGVFHIPFQGVYSAAKSAIFMLSSTLRIELKPFGVRVCMVDPGDTRTGFTEQREYTAKTAQTAYRQPFERALYEMIRCELAAPGPEKCAKMVLKMARKKNPPARVSVGFGYKTLFMLAKMLPFRWREIVIRILYLRRDPPKDAVWTYEKQFGKGRQ